MEELTTLNAILKQKLPTKQLQNTWKCCQHNYSWLGSLLGSFDVFIQYVVSQLSNGYSRQIHETRSLLVQIWWGESHFSQKWPLANFGKSGEYSVNGLANVGESGESSQNGLANVCESGESSQNGLVNVGESGESSQNSLANVGKSGESRKYVSMQVLVKVYMIRQVAVV